MRVAEVCAAAGVGRETLRFYERRGLLREGVHFTRRASGTRDYQQATLERLNLVSLAKRAGVTVNELVQWIDEWENGCLSLADKRAFFEDKLRTVDRAMAELAEMRRYLVDKLDDLAG